MIEDEWHPNVSTSLLDARRPELLRIIARVVDWSRSTPRRRHLSHHKLRRISGSSSFPFMTPHKKHARQPEDKKPLEQRYLRTSIYNTTAAPHLEPNLTLAWTLTLAASPLLGFMDVFMDGHPRIV